MARKRTPSRRPAQAKLPKDRCPHCGGPLTFPSSQPEAFCPACRIFVEILTPLPKARNAETDTVETVEKRRELARMYLEFEDLFGEGGDEEPDATEAPAKALREAPPAQAESEAARGAPPALPTDAPASPVTHASPQAPRERPAPREPEGPRPAFAPSPVPLALPSGPVKPIVPAPVPPEPAAAEAMPSPEPIAEPSAELEFEEFEAPVPSAGIEVPDEAYIDTEPELVDAGAAHAAPTPKGWHRAVFFTGASLVAFGGSGLVLGSLLHDMLRVPFIGRAYETFGPLNVSAAVLGTVFLAGGLIAMGVGILAGSRPRPVAGW